MGISELKKPHGVWCPHCKPGLSCKIYENRPNECRNFYCGFLTNDILGEEWRPSYSKIIITGKDNGKHIIANVDPVRPDAWRREPYYSWLKKWAGGLMQTRGQVLARIDRHFYVIFPDRDVDMGLVDDDETIYTGQRQTPAGLRLEAVKVKNDDPRFKGLMPDQIISLAGL
jgi:hypothetical protein